jgi:subtilase family serine protease
MRSRRIVAAFATCGLMLFGLGGQSSGTALAATSVLHKACGGTVPVGQVRCFAEWRGGGGTRAAVLGPSTVGLPGKGYGPADIASAYQLDTTAGAGQTIGIVDAYDNPKVESDLAAYRAAWGLPPCTTADGCFRKVNQRGGMASLPYRDAGWGVEISLDVQAVSAACPNCKILLVEADSASFTDIGKSVNTAVRLGANVVSNSYGGDEFNGILAMGTAYYTHPGVAQVASSGDYGFGPAQFPAVSPHVIGVGGTTLRKPQGVWHETAWWGSGSGCSAWVDKPAYQVDKHCQMRTVADVSAVADPRPGFAVYDTFGLGRYDGWIQVGGTSLSSPLLAGMIGLAGNAAKLGDAGYLYSHRSGLSDVVGGSNGFCGGDYLCNGKVGYDAPTGLGSPRGTSAL